MPRPTEPSSPSQCRGDGSYGAAIECFRIAERIAFSTDDGEGVLSRPTPGAEILDYVVPRGDKKGRWRAESRREGIVWTRDGEGVAAVPPPHERLFQILTIFPQPQMREGAPQRLSDHAAHARYRFTDVNTGEVYEADVALADGDLVRLQIGQRTFMFRRQP